jgi:UDP-GlcNAc:undecaprenyl-phosphate/decaprenyl-phosphate GlcNAc-1-phosphate transferase
MVITLNRYVLFGLVPFVLSLVFTPAVRYFALKNGLVSYPRADRWHKHPTAILGGIGIYFASMVTALLMGIVNKSTIGLFIGATFVFVAGLLDDRFHFRPYTKLFLQIIAACIAIFSGATLGLPVNKLITIPLTLIWIVGVTNSFNLLDNIDGLAAGIAAISSSMIFLSSLIFANNALGIFSLILAGAALGFLPYNLNPAKIFMGDSGSMFLGYSLAVVSISGTARHISDLFATILIPVFILSVPIFDTIFVMIKRKLGGRRAFEGGTDHTSHSLVALGLSPRKTVFILYIISIAFGLIALSYSRLDIFIISVIAFLSMVILLFFGVFLSGTVDYKDELDYRKWQDLRDNKTVLNNIFLYKRRIVEVLLDLAFVCVAYYSAYFLRFQGAYLSSNLQLLEKSLVWLILIKISVFYLFGLYKGVWKYISISDLITIFKAITLGSIFSMISFTLLFRFQDFSRAVFFLDWLILLVLVSGSRILFRVLGELFINVGKEGRNVLIFGAGDAGEMAIREIKRNKTLNYNPVGFIDDDPSKFGYKIQGVPVLGSRDLIKDIVLAQNIEEVIIAVPSLDAGIFHDIVKICRDCGVSYRKIKGILDKEENDTWISRELK